MVVLGPPEPRRKLHPLPFLSNLTAVEERLRQAGARPGVLALDVSRRAIGVAGADASWQLASPLLTIRRKGQPDDLRALRRLIEERGATILVVGWPLNMDGSEGPRCQAVRAFAHSLDAAFGLPILLFDERLTTFAAKEIAAGRGLGGAKRRGTPDLDALAAAQILQDCLDALARQTARRAQPEAG
jgi:putative holliday junction resolvase